jgi:hypothetical protein
LAGWPADHGRTVNGGFLNLVLETKEQQILASSPSYLPELVYVSIRRIAKGNDTIMQESEEKPQLLAMLKT